MTPHLRPAEPADAEAIARLLGSFATNPKSDPAVLAWQQLDNPLGPAVATVATVAEGALVAHWMAYPLRARLDGVTTIIGKSGDGVVDPDHRGRGLASAVAAATDEGAARRGWPLVLSTPNAASVGLLRAAGLQALGAVPVWVRPVGDGLAERLPGPLGAVARPVLGRTARRPRSRAAAPGPDVGLRPAGQPGHTIRVTSAAVTEVEAELDALWADLRPTNADHVVHDSAFWSWRLARPGARSRLVVARRGGEAVGAAAAIDGHLAGVPGWFVLDAIAVDHRVRRALLRALVAAAPRDAALVAVCAFGQPELRRDLVSTGFAFVPQPGSRRTYIGLRGTAAEAAARRPWRITWADFDHI